VVIDDRCAPSAIREAIAARTEGCASEVFVVAPVGADTRRHLDATLDELAMVRELDVRRGKVGSHDPIQSADEGLREFPADEIVFTVAACGGSERPKARAVDIAPSRYDIPVTVTQVTATAAAQPRVGS
jgi:hypothetical protein